MKQRLFEILIIFIAFFLPGFIWQNRSYDQGSAFMSDYMLQFLLIAVPQIIMISYVLWIQDKHALAEFGIVKLKFIDLPISVIIYLGIFVLLMILSLLISLLPYEGRKLFYPGFRWKLSDPKLIPLVFLFSIATGYREEIFFRSYLLTRFAQMGSNPAVNLVLSSLIFAGGHIYQGLAGFTISFTQGLFFGLVFLKTKNIHHIALPHALYNTTILLTSLFTDFPLPGN